MTRKAYDLLLTGGKIVSWDSTGDGVAAAQSYADSHPGATVVAWRDGERRGLHPYMAQIVEATR